MTTVLITGGTGMIGSALIARLKAKGYFIHVLSRSVPEEETEGEQTFRWDPSNGQIDPAALEGVNGIVHLAGAGIADKRWTVSRKRVLLESRTKSAELLKTQMREVAGGFRFFITASGSNYYSTERREHIFKESDDPGSDFLAQICVEWERAAFDNNPAQRICAIRTAMVLSASGGALEKLAAPVKWGLGAALGSGKQFNPWIHIDDLVGIYVKAIEDERMTGAYNAVADQYLTQREMTNAIASAYNKKIWLPNVPGWALRIVLGEMSNMLLKGSRLSNDKLLDLGYKFKYPRIDAALNDLIRTP